MGVKKIPREDWAGWGWTTRFRMGRLRFHPQVCRGEVSEWLVNHEPVIAPGHLVEIPVVSEQEDDVSACRLPRPLRD